jgi:hypothetical protein
MHRFAMTSDATLSLSSKVHSALFLSTFQPNVPAVAPFSQTRSDLQPCTSHTPRNAAPSCSCAVLHYRYCLGTTLPVISSPSRSRVGHPGR